MPEPPKRVVVVEYDPAWPDQFEGLRLVLASRVAELAVAIHHVGSTAVPSLAAKPIIDIDIEIPSRDSLPELVARLAELGYDHQGDLGVTGREAFRNRAATDVPRDGSGRTRPRHHLYACASGNRSLVRHLAFRDYLRDHPEAVEEYGDLKFDLSAMFPQDIESYIAGKTGFVERVLRLADCTV